MRPIEPLVSVNHTLPSGPVVIPAGCSAPVATVETTPAGVMRPIELPCPVNHRLPSGPRAIWSGSRDAPVGKADDGARGCDPADRVVAEIGEPQRPVRTRRDAAGWWMPPPVKVETVPDGVTRPDRVTQP